MLFDPGSPDVPASASSPPAVTWRGRFCRRLGRLCDLFRGAHEARIPF